MQESTLAAAPARYPREIPMPDGSGPEYIAIGEGPFAYVSSLKTGAIFLVDLEHGTHELIVTPEAVWITDSFAPVLYKLPFGDRG